jgi:hypothetical protein
VETSHITWLCNGYYNRQNLPLALFGNETTWNPTLQSGCSLGHNHSRFINSIVAVSTECCRCQNSSRCTQSYPWWECPRCLRCHRYTVIFLLSIIVSPFCTLTQSPVALPLLSTCTLSEHDTNVGLGLLVPHCVLATPPKTTSRCIGFAAGFDARIPGEDFHRGIGKGQASLSFAGSCCLYADGLHSSFISSYFLSIMLSSSGILSLASNGKT